MTSAAVAVTISAFRGPSWPPRIAYGAIALVFLYTTVVNVFERPDGVRIASFFIGLILVVSFVSRLVRSLELRVERFEIDPEAERIIQDVVARSREPRLVPNRPETCDTIEYDREERDARVDHEIPDDEPIIILEVYVSDPSEFATVVRVRGVEIGDHQVLRLDASAIPNAIAAFLLYLRDRTGKRPHAYFNWTEGNPALHLIRYLLSGEGETAPVTREILRQHEPNPDRRPGIHAAM